MNKQQKQIAIVAAGAIVLYLVYRWYRGQSTAATGAGAASPDTASTDFAALSGQEQGDVAALQSQNSSLLSQEQGDISTLQQALAGLSSDFSGQNAQIQSQEQSDVAALQGSLSGLGAQEGSDVSGLTGALGSVTSTLEGLGNQYGNLQGQVAALGTGTTRPNRAPTVTAHKGGAFYKYYVKVTGKRPPTSVQVSNFVYQAWKSGVSVTALQKKPPAHHAGTKNTSVAHPNPGHQPRPPMHKAAPHPGRVPTAPPKRSGAPKYGHPKPRRR